MTQPHQFVDLYALLEIDLKGRKHANVDAGEIKKAYRRLAMENHPDRLAGLPEAERLERTAHSQRLNDAYKYLKDDALRQHYDAYYEVRGHGVAGRTFDEYMNLAKRAGAGAEEAGHEAANMGRGFGQAYRNFSDFMRETDEFLREAGDYLKETERLLRESEERLARQASHMSEGKVNLLLGAAAVIVTVAFAALMGEHKPRRPAQPQRPPLPPQANRPAPPLPNWATRMQQQPAATTEIKI